MFRSVSNTFSKNIQVFYFKNSQMIRLLHLLTVLCIVSLSTTAQMSSINTSQKDALLKDFKTFIILDESTGMVLAKNPENYNMDKPMPLNFFTMVLPEGVTKYIPGNPRTFIIHSLQTSGSLGEQDWVLESNLEENSTFFARNKYINNKLSKQWMVLIDGQRVVFKNIRTNEFLSIDKNGNYHSVPNFAEATRWKLIHSF